MKRRSLLTRSARLLAVGVVLVGIVSSSNQPVGSAPVPQTSVITLVAGNGTAGYGSGNLGVATTAPFGETWAVGDADGNYFTTEYSTCRLRKINRGGLVSDVAGTGVCGYYGGATPLNPVDPGAAATAQFNGPLGLALDGSGDLLFADSVNCLVRRVDLATNTVTNVAGTPPVAGVPQCGLAGDGAAATAARLKSPMAVAVDADNNILIADGDNCRVRKVAGGVITTIAGSTCGPVAGDNGPALSAVFNKVTGIAVDGAGQVYVSDGKNSRVRLVTNSATVVPVAGTTAGLSGDNGPATGAKLSYPFGLTVASNGTLYIADALNCRVRAVIGGIISTFAGSTCGNDGDRVAPTNAKLLAPAAVSMTPGGDLVVSDSFNRQIKVINRVAAPVGTGGYQHTTLTNDFRSYGNTLVAGKRTWTGGDATYSLELPTGHVLWIFADSFATQGVAGATGSVNAGHQRVGNPFQWINNQVVLETPPSVSSPAPQFTNKWRTGAVGQSFFVPPPPLNQNHIYWPAMPFMKNPLTVGVLLRQTTFANDWYLIDGVALSTIPLVSGDPALQWQPSTPVLLAGAAPANPRAIAPNAEQCDANIAFADSVMKEGNDLYVYGVEMCRTTMNGYLHVAKVINNDLTNPNNWGYWNGSTFVFGPGGVASMQRLTQADAGGGTSVIQSGWFEYSVVKTGTGAYRMISSRNANTMNSGDYNEIIMRTATSPAGPFSPETHLYTAPESGQPAYSNLSPDCVLWTYNGKEHPEFNVGDEIVISYNVGVSARDWNNRAACGGVGADNASTNVDNYRPRFITYKP